MFLRRIIFISLAFCAIYADSLAQEANVIVFSQEEKTSNIFNHLDIALTAGTTGIGFDLSAPIGNSIQLRTGFTYMPRMEINSTFRVQVGDSLDNKYDKQGNRIETKFDRLSGYLHDFVGFEVDDEIRMVCTPSFYNFKLLVDFSPFQNKRWHFTTGFFLGPARVAYAENATEEMSTLLSVSIWNNFYDKSANGEPMLGDMHFSPEAEQQLSDKLMKYGRMGFHAGNYLSNGPILPAESDAFPVDFTATGDPIYAFDEEHNPILTPVKVDEDGNAVRAYKKGDPYMMVPDEETGMVKACVKVYRFKPYVGFGYGGAISKDGLTRLSFDAGVMFWGGTPSMITHDGTDLTKDVENVKGKLGRYVDTAKFFKVFPMLEIRISRRIF